MRKNKNRDEHNNYRMEEGSIFFFSQIVKGKKILIIAECFLELGECFL